MKAFSVRKSEDMPRTSRRLRVEVLEERRLLDAAAGQDLSSQDLTGSDEPWAEPAAATSSLWQNPVFRLDVNRDGKVSPSDALVIINRLFDNGPGPLPAPGPVPEPYYDTNGNGGVSSLDVLNVFNGLLNPPKVGVSSLTDFTIDVTPQVTVKATSTAALPNGTTLLIDVDLNNDGKFTGAGETGRTASALFNGSSTFDITPAIERKNVTYTINVRARLQDADGVQGTSPVMPLLVDTLTSDVLQTYTHSFDPAYHYTIADTKSELTYTYYALDMTSQTWRSADEVDKPVWRHWVQIIVPTLATSHTALLLINGGSNNNFNTPPPVPGSGGDPDTDAVLDAALSTNTVTVVLSQIPSEPLVFSDEPGNERSEDEIIAYSFDKFMDNLGQPGNETWPVLLAMTKSTVRAMDSVQDLVVKKSPSQHVDDFVVTGFSKRGWTTWLTAAADTRVKAIIPGVFDNLDQGMQMVHHYGAYGFFSQAVKPYNDLEVFDRILTPEGLELSRIVDPYRYLGDPRFATMPKLILNSTGDEFFASDSSQYYFHDLPGTKNYLRYIPNTGHGLDGDPVVQSSFTFYDAVLKNKTLPQFSWTIAQDGSIQVHSDTAPTEVKLWQATNPNARDFRKQYNPGIVWTSSNLGSVGAGNYVGDVAMPATGARAYMVELTFANPDRPAYPYVFTTDVRVKTNLPLFAWPFESGLPTGSLAETLADPLAAGSAGIADASVAAQLSGRSPEDERGLQGVIMVLSQMSAPPTEYLSLGAIAPIPRMYPDLTEITGPVETVHFLTGSVATVIDLPKLQTSDDNLGIYAVDEVHADESLLEDESSLEAFDLLV